MLCCEGGWVSSVAVAVDNHLAGIQNCKSLGAGARRLSRRSLLEASVWRSRSFPPRHRKGGAAIGDFCTSFLRLSYKSKSMDLRKTILREPKTRQENQTQTQHKTTHKTSRFPLLTPMDWAGRPKAAGSTKAPASKLSTTGSSHRNVCAW